MTTFIIIILAICLTIQYVVALVKEHFWLAIFFMAEIMMFGYIINTPI